jgi:hypothetical protein
MEKRKTGKEWEIKLKERIRGKKRQERSGKASWRKVIVEKTGQES